MSEHVLKLIDELRGEIDEAEKSLKPKKILVNQLCSRAGIEQLYPGIEDQQGPPGVLQRIRRNQFYGRPLSTCIREYLEMRVSFPVREATLDEIFEALKEGGYDVKTSGSTEEDQKRGISIALGKNSQTFHRLASGDIGLLAWYPNIKEAKDKKPKNGESASKVENPTIDLGETRVFAMPDTTGVNE
jgi:hypothetical protein